MKYRTKTHRGGDKWIIWDIEDGDPVYPTLSEISEVAIKEFPNIPLNKLAIIPLGCGDGIILKLAR